MKQAMTVTLRIEYEKAPCDRCCGSGRFPSSIRNGVCFDCNGKKIALSRAGRASKKKFEAWSDTLLVRVADLQPGDVYRPNAGMGWCRVVAVGRGFSGPVPVPPNGYLEIDTIEHGRGRYMQCGYGDEATVRRWPTDDELRAIAPTLGKGARLVEVDP